MGLAVDPDGSVKSCCIAKEKIKKSSGTAYNLGYDSLKDIINSPDYVEIRRKMLAGEEVPGCIQCYNIEKYNPTSSKRTLYNTTWLSDVDIQNKIAQGTHIISEVHEFDLRFGNLCNLACRSCLPINSSQLEKELVDLESTTNIKQFFQIETYAGINDWYQTDLFTENFNSTVDKIKSLYITGGEPTIIKKNYEIMQLLVDRGYSKNIKLIFNSNMTNMNPSFYDLLPHFKTVIFYASIDGYGSIQEYLRYPSNWEQIDKNIHKLLELGDHIVIKPTPVIQIGNLNKITDLFEYFESFNRSANKSIINIWCNQLEFPSHLNIVHLPTEYKKMCWDRIENWVDTKCKFQYPMFHQTLRTLKNKCLLDSHNPREMANFFEMNDIFDNNRNHYLRNINPELYALR